MDQPHIRKSSNEGRFVEQLASPSEARRHTSELPEVVPNDEYFSQTTSPSGDKASHIYQQFAPSLPEVVTYDVQMSEKARQLASMSPGLQSVMDDEGFKEALPPLPGYQSHVLEQNPPLEYMHTGEKTAQKTRICGISTTKFYILLAAVILLVLGAALGIGLGLGLSTDNESSTASEDPSSKGDADYLIGGALDASFYSKSGAFNGSGIALASQSFADQVGSGTHGAIVMYFQHHSGEIRYIQLDNDGQWLGGSASEVVAVDAKNSTPLSVVSYSIGGQNTWHVFYIDTQNNIKQRTNSNTTNVWADGPINDLNLQALEADQVGMQACWYGNDYGDSDYAHTPLSNENSTSATAYSSSVGMHIWYASDASTFEQLGWRSGDDQWAHQGSFPRMNGHAGVGCYSWGPGTVTYVMMVNEENTAEIYWKDTNTNTTSTNTHPINEWVKSAVSIPHTNPATSLGYTNFFYLQLEDNTINAYNISWAAEKTAITPDSQFVVGDQPGISGTHLSVTALPNQGGGNSILVFYQVEGDDVTEYTRDLLAGQWTSLDVPIPDA